MLRYPLIHPPLLGALAAAGHGSKILIADANYAHATNVNPRAALIHLNLRPGVVNSDVILETLLTAVPVEAAEVMRTDDSSTPPVWTAYTEHLGTEMPLKPLARHDFYATCLGDELAVCVASGDQRLYANLLLTVGVVS
ncbi:L-fucose mutarotase [Herbihabitans rhizosphaerae]|uniref:L-fucose mutarotase n=1 Tax=Herbihabitans rhizosphaerae TaxID=1872711 RepID=A0A4Q7KFT7_9PSEU|nr:RbsD/FucU family protein [Herbihabitans rhizosphaerae]RZS34093.1 L-fucose mutarotase [Herbihabitans rhizosphaerae]